MAPTREWTSPPQLSRHVNTGHPSWRHAQREGRIARPGCAHGGEPGAYRSRFLRCGVHLVRVVDGLHVRERRDSLAEQGELLGRVHAEDRKSTRLNSSHGYISYAVFCLKKKKT